MRTPLVILIAFAVFSGIAPVVFGAPDVTCDRCHVDQARQLSQSTHASFACQQCHRGEPSYAVSATDLKGYRRAAAEKKTAPSFDHGQNFAGKPTRTEIVNLCGTCHADVERMNPFGIRTDQLARYWTSTHGKILASKGDERVAVCVDCHGTHDILPAREPQSRTHPFNVPGTCATCHADVKLMGEFGLSPKIVDEYRSSVHGKLLFNMKDTGAPTCATCHGNHSASPPGFATVSTVCGKCHPHEAKYFSTSIHASLEEFKGCVQCHGGGEGSQFHHIERITKPAGVLIQRYAHLLESVSDPTSQQITEAIHPDPKQIITGALPTCLECHEDLDEDESLPTLFELLDEIAAAERTYVETAQRLDTIGKGVALVDRERFRLEDARTHLIALAPTQHTLSNKAVAAEVEKLSTICTEINDGLDKLELGLSRRYEALIPIWVFAVIFSAALYVKFKRLKKAYVKPASTAPTTSKD